MYELVELFEPSETVPWLINVILLYAIPYLTVWFTAVILCRLNVFSQDRVIVRVYWGWLIPLCLHTVGSSILLLATAKYYKELGISLWYCMAYLIPVFLSGSLGIDLSNKIRDRVKKETT